MQFALQALPFPRHAHNDAVFAPVWPALHAVQHVRAASTVRTRAPASTAPSAGTAVRILRCASKAQEGRVLISGRMADVCAALNRLAGGELACG